LLVELSGASDSDLDVTLTFKERAYDAVSLSYTYTPVYTLNYTTVAYHLKK